MDYDKAKRNGTASLALGILGIIFMFSVLGTILGIIVSIIGIILGLKAIKVLNKKDRKIAVKGFICSIVALIVNIACIYISFTLYFKIKISVLEFLDSMLFQAIKFLFILLFYYYKTKLGFS